MASPFEMWTFKTQKHTSFLQKEKKLNKTIDWVDGDEPNMTSGVWMSEAKVAGIVN